MSVTPEESSPAYRPDIDGLRAVAVLAVVLYHAFPTGSPGGFVGVDIFFVISGFLISTILLSQMARGRFSFVDFYSRRARRIFPALLAVLLACFVAGWVLLLPREFRELGGNIGAAAAFLSNFLLWHQAGYFDTSAEAKPLLHLWSLGIEEQFYVLWPLLLVVSGRFRRALPLLIGGLAVASFAYCLYITEHTPVAAFFSPASRWWELMLGGLLAEIVLGRGTLKGGWSNAASLLGAVLIGGTLLLLDPTQPFPGWRAAVPALGTFLLLYAGPGAGLNRALLSNRLLVGIGLISYPLYLWHWPLLSFARIFRSAPLGVERTVAALLAALVLAWLTYRFIERPIRFGTLIALPRRWLAPALYGLLATAGAVGVVVHLANGFVSRPVLGQVRPEVVVDWPRTEHPPCADRASMSPIMAEACYAHVNVGAPRKVVLWGDSHAPPWAVDFEALASKDGFELYVLKLNGCPPLTGIRRTDIKESLAVCDTLKPSQDLFDAILALHPDVVVMAARWSNFSHGWIRNGRLMPGNSFLTTDPDGIATRETSRQALAERIPATIEALEAHKISVVVIRNPPVLNFEVTNLRKSITELEVTPAENDALSRYTDDIFAKVKGFELYDPAKLICKTTCSAVVDGHELYVDDNHLGVFGAKLFEDQIDRLMMRVLAARG